MSARPANVSDTERTVAGVAAVVLLASIGLRHPLKLIVAGGLVYRALSGHCYGYEWLGTGTCKLPTRA